MVLEKDLLADVDRERGTFRAYVKATLKNFVLGKRRAEGAQKRGEVPIRSLCSTSPMMLEVVYWTTPTPGASHSLRTPASVQLIW